MKKNTPSCKAEEQVVKSLEKSQPKLASDPQNCFLQIDCLEGMKSLTENCVSLTFVNTYYASTRASGYKFEPEKIIAELFRITQPGGCVVWVVQDFIVDHAITGTSLEHVSYFREAGWLWHDEINLARDRRLYPCTNERYGPTEKVYVFSKGRPKTVNMLRDRPTKTAGQRVTRTSRHGGDLVRTLTDRITKELIYRLPWWLYGADSHPINCRDDHPIFMPETIVEDLILALSDPGDLVFDPISDGGKPCKMAFLNNRRYLGMATDEGELKVALWGLECAKSEKATYCDA